MQHREWHSSGDYTASRKRMVQQVTTFVKKTAAFNMETVKKYTRMVESSLFHDATSWKEYKCRKTLPDRVNNTMEKLCLPMEPPENLDDNQTLATLLHGFLCEYDCPLGKRCYNYGAMFVAAEEGYASRRMAALYGNGEKSVLNFFEYFNTLLKNGADENQILAAVRYVIEAYENPKYMLSLVITTEEMQKKYAARMLQMLNDGITPPLVDLEECPICLDRFPDFACRPSVCMHTICKYCMSDWNKQQDKSTCPFCRTEFFLTVSSCGTSYRCVKLAHPV